MIKGLLLAGAAMLFALMSVQVTFAQGCNIDNVLSGGLMIELIKHTPTKELGYYETGVIFRDGEDQIVGSMQEAERDGSNRIEDVNGQPCGVIEKNLHVSVEDESNKEILYLRNVGGSAFVIIRDGRNVGTIEGRFPQ